MGDFSAHLNASGLEPQEAPLTPGHMAALLQMIDNQMISGKIAKEVMAKVFATGKSPREIVESEGLLHITDQSVLEKLVDEVIAANPTACSHTAAVKPRPWASWWAVM